MKNESLFKLTDELKSKLIAAIADKNVADLIAKTKASGDSDSGTFKCIVSTTDQDRQGEIVMQDGWDLSFYKANPVVLWAHDYSALPVGVCTNIYVENNQLVAEGKFAPASANPFAQQVRQLYDLGMVNTTSVGFIPKEFKQEEHGNTDYATITKAELLEFSFVPVPANAHATAMRALTRKEVKELGIDVPMFKTKGLNLRVKDANIGSSCELDDGTPGILAIDPANADGPLVCIPAKAISIGKSESMKALVKDLGDEHILHTSNHDKSISVFKDAFNKEYSAKAEGMDMEKMECYKSYVYEHGLENQRHSKAITEAVENFSKSFEMADDNEKAMFEKSMIQKAGKKISAATAEIVKEAMGHIMKGHDTLGEMIAEVDGEDDGKKTVTVESKKVENSIDSFEEFLASRETWKTIDKAAESVLKAMSKIDIKMLRGK